MAESYDAGETVSAVARRYALSPQQLFAWRRAARVPLAETLAPEPLFVPAVVRLRSWNRRGNSSHNANGKPPATPALSSWRSTASPCVSAVAPTPRRSRR
ncbi:transposase [Mesorhizobium sp. NPDC059024]|uniref:transposase n=1 Tax=Mesorhizobium sp. NPDC059024 TaxID=3346707 RepID=UPI0036BE3AF0